MKFEVSKWLNTETVQPVFGVAARDKGKVYQLADEGKQLIFDGEKEAQEFVDLMNSLPRCGICGKPMAEAMPKVEDAECGTCCAEHF